MRPGLAIALFLAIAWGTARAEDEQVPITERVEAALKSMPSPYGLHLLQEIIDQADHAQRLEVISLLEQQRRVDARPLVVALTSNPDPTIAQRAVEAMGALGAGSSADHDAIDAALLNGDERVRRAAVLCIRRWGDLRHVPTLAATFKSDTARVKDDALEVLVGLTGQNFGQDPVAWTDWYHQREAATQTRFEALRERLRSPDGKIVAQAIGELTAFGDRRAETVELLKPFLKDEDDRVAAAAYAALKSIAPQELLGVEEIKAPPGPKAPPRPKAAAPPPPSGGSPWGAILGAIVIFGLGWWWIRRLTAGTRGPSVAEVVARAQREAGIDSERNAPVVRKPPTRPAPVVAGVKPAAAKPAAPAAPPAAKGSPKPAVDVAIGKRGEKIFKLD